MLPGKSRTLFGVTPSSFRPQPSICFGTVGIDRVTIQISSRDLTRRRLAFPIPTMTLGDHGSPSHSPLALWREHEVRSLQRQEPLQILMRLSIPRVPSSCPRLQRRWPAQNNTSERNNVV